MLKYVGRTATNKNYIQEEIKSRLNSVKVATIQFRNFCLPVSYLKICLSVTLNVWEILYLTLREHRLRVMWRTSAYKRERATAYWENCIKSNFTFCIVPSGDVQQNL
jgi:hypothetical protein